MELVTRAFRTLELLCQNPSGLTVGDAAKLLDLPMSSTYRILNSLKECNYVIQNTYSKKYSVSYKLFSLCDMVHRNDLLISTVRPAMEQLCEKIKKNIILCVPQEDKTLNLDCVEYKNASMYKIRKGYESNWYTTSAGRVFMAFSSDDKKKAALEHLSIKAETSSTITNINDLEKELVKIKKQGYALIDEELQENVQGVAAPVFDAAKQVIAAIAFTTQKRMSPVNSSEISELLKCTQTISSNLNSIQIK
jgi:DNA-binding IclR family transcriptional regulator